ncbi:hypothetical protein BDW42DRAFT_163637 [Aspergillus taichungensis]|uniref:Uncharacterized protein n=1 Tax=Aspergillus taichungensis TaxID=482145 RepID=A0A2J5I2N9_9EURO|nr:hypothetical protein BDW42DRAFT_163637 [Aspergillus taichungensis]
MGNSHPTSFSTLRSGPYNACLLLARDVDSSRPDRGPDRRQDIRYQQGKFISCQCQDWNQTLSVVKKGICIRCRKEFSRGPTGHLQWSSYNNHHPHNGMNRPPRFPTTTFSG